MQQTLQPIPVALDGLNRKPDTAIAHLPGPRGHWLFGNVQQLVPDPGPYLKTQQAQYGDCFTVGFFRNARAVMLLGPLANELVLLDSWDLEK